MLLSALRDENSRYRGRWQGQKLLKEKYPDIDFTSDSLTLLFKYLIHKIPEHLKIHTILEGIVDLHRVGTVLVYYVAVWRYWGDIQPYMPCELILLRELAEEKMEYVAKYEELCGRVGLSAAECSILRADKDKRIGVVEKEEDENKCLETPPVVDIDEDVDIGLDISI